MRIIVFLILLLVFFNKSFAQKEITSIPLDNSLGKLSEIIQFSDGQGNTLFKFDGKDYCQYSILFQDTLIKSKIQEIDDRFEFLECIRNNNDFTLFYRDTKKGDINIYNIGGETSAQFEKTNIQGSEESYLANAYYNGNFLVFRYTQSPFTIHTYTYKDGQYFQKKSQSFKNSSNEKLFLGKIQTENEIIFVRLTFNNPFAFHFYRYEPEKGFEKRSVNIEDAYREVGVKTKVVPSALEYTPSNQLSAYVQKNHVYLDMGNLVHLNPSLSRKINSRQFPGILEFDWKNEKGEIISFDRNNTTDFGNRSVAMLDNLYFKLIVTKNYFDLSIFELSSRELLKRFTYNQDEEIEILNRSARLQKTKSVNLNLSSMVFFPMEVGKPNAKDIDTKELLRKLSRGELFLNVFSDGNLIELNVSGIDIQERIFDVILEASFSCYFLKEDLSVIKNFDYTADARYAQIDEYVNELIQKNKEIEKFIVYSDHGKTHIAYIDKKNENCRIIVYE